MKSLLILGCSATKRPGQALLPAYERYDGPLWRVLRCWQRQQPRWEDILTVWALSARYGMFDARIAIPDYEQRMTRAFASNLTTAVACSWRLYSAPRATYVSLGAAYAPIVASCPWPAQTATGGIGERLAGLKAWLGGLS